MWPQPLYSSKPAVSDCNKDGNQCNGICLGEIAIFQDATIKNKINLQSEFSLLWKRAEELWTEHENESSFGAYVSADYTAVLDALIRMQDRADTFLEWGSGLGVVAIMASRLGYRAYGIEAEAELVMYSQELAKEFDSDAEFVTGGFIPDQFVWQPELGQESVRTAIDVADAYDNLGFDLQDFDLIYGYPWPTEHELFKGIMRSCGSPHSHLLIYDAREGIAVYDARDWG